MMMFSWFAVGEWLTGYLDRLRYPETTLAIKQAARVLGAKATIKGEDALIFSAPYGLLLYIGGSHLQAYCCVYDREKLDLQTAKRLHFIQHGEPLRPNTWIWFPRVDEDGATNYQIERNHGRHVWIINRVMPAVATRFEAKSRRDAIVTLGSRIASDFQSYQQKLAKISAQGPVSA